VLIVEDVPGGFGLRRVFRGVVVLLGVGLLMGGIFAGVVVALWLATVAETAARGEEMPRPLDNELPGVAVTTLAAALALWAGVRLIRGRRRLGLYLRKFGFAETTRVVSHALGSAVGRSLRLVTLDDSLAAPMGSGRGRRRLAGLVWLLAAGLVAWLLYYLFGGPFAHDVRRQVQTQAGATHAQAGNNVFAGLGEAISAGVNANIGVAIVAAMIALLVTVALSIALTIGVLGGGVYLASRRAERRASRALTDERKVEKAARALAAAGRRIFAARLVVVAVPTPFWQRAVHALATVSDVVVIDVSQPGDSLIWEIENIKPLFDGRCVLVGSRDYITALNGPGSPTLLARLLDGEEIIAYGSDRRRFARALRQRLTQLRHHAAGSRNAESRQHKRAVDHPVGKPTSAPPMRS
jgi:hypothetical protein